MQKLSEEELEEWLHKERIRIDMEYEKSRKSKLSEIIDDSEEQSKKQSIMDKETKIN